ncbi:hypothetical protein AAY473_011433 [Plecturocebus cupreus]
MRLLHGPKTPVSSGLGQEPHRGTHPFPRLPPAPSTSARSRRLRGPVANCSRCTVLLQPGPLRWERKEQVMPAPPAKQIPSHDRAAPLAAAPPAPPGPRRAAAWESLQACRRARGPLQGEPTAGFPSRSSGLLTPSHLAPAALPELALPLPFRQPPPCWGCGASLLPAAFCKQPTGRAFVLCTSRSRCGVSPTHRVSRLNPAELWGRSCSCFCAPRPERKQTQSFEARHRCFGLAGEEGDDESSH